MKKSSQNKEVEKLKKQVEKLKADKASLQKLKKQVEKLKEDKVSLQKAKKQVEKLKEDKTSLQKTIRNLKGRLNTSRSRNAKYRSALKKKEKPSAGLDKEAFEQIMNLLDDIITPV